MPQKGTKKPRRKEGDRWRGFKMGIEFWFTKKDGKIVTDGRITPYVNKERMNNKYKDMSEIKYDRRGGKRGRYEKNKDGARTRGVSPGLHDNNLLRGNSNIYLAPKNNERGMVKSRDHSFNPEIHVMIPNPNGKGWIQRKKEDLKEI